jgi:hypothetical protein
MPNTVRRSAQRSRSGAGSGIDRLPPPPIRGQNFRKRTGRQLKNRLTFYDPQIIKTEYGVQIINQQYDARIILTVYDL